MVQDRKKSFQRFFLWLLDGTTVSVLVLVSTRSGLLNVLSAGLFLCIACVGSMKPLLGVIPLGPSLSSAPQCASQGTALHFPGLHLSAL